MDGPEIKLERPLFYKSPFGLRFEIGPSDQEIWSDESKSLKIKYFNVALERSKLHFSQMMILPLHIKSFRMDEEK